MSKGFYINSCLLSQILLREKLWVWCGIVGGSRWRMRDWKNGWSYCKKWNQRPSGSKRCFQIYGMSISIYG